MKRLVFSTSLICIGSVFALAQQSSPTPPVPEDQVVKISTNLIQIDATVTDKAGKVVTDLKPEEFEVFENGEKQKISNLSFISKIVGGSTVGANSGNPASTVPDVAPPLDKNSVRRTVAIVVDDLNLSFASIYYTRKALNRFVEEQMQPYDLVAIIRTGGGVGALQQFTSDKRLLHAAIERLRWNPLGAAGLDALASVGQNPQDITERFSVEGDAVANAQSPDKPVHSILLRENVSDKKRTDFEVAQNANESEVGIYQQASLATTKYIISGMNQLPGRKVMMLFSDGMRIGSESNKSRTSSVYGFLQDVVDYANRSSVVVYTFDTKGLQSLSIQAADSTYEVIDGHREQKEREREATFKSSQDGLVYLANQTGGKALLDSNGLNDGMQRALDEQAGYYLLGYQPDAETFNAAERRFNKLEVKVLRPGLKVSYRSGFFSSPGSTPTDTKAVTNDAMAKALMSPFASNDIGLAVNALYASDPTDGPYIRSFLHIDAKNLKFSDDTEGWKKATFDVAAVTFGDNGVPVENAQTTYTIKTKGATHETMLQKGFVYTLIVPVKKPGVYQFRVALRDTATGKIGSASQIVDIPDVAKQKLTMSTLAVEDVSRNTWENITQGKVGNGPGQVQIASTLLYDTVLKQFSAGTVLRYGFEVYNAKHDGSQTSKLETQARIMQNNKALIEGNVNKFESVAQNAAPNPRVSGAILLKDTLLPGDYVLQITVRDLLSKQMTTQLFPFEVIK
jgi:VWFA-related protein